jgi:maleate isomerase
VRCYTGETRIKATTSTLGLNKALVMLDVWKLGLVTPYTADVQGAIINNMRESELPLMWSGI